MSYTVSPNMNLVIPGVGSESGPDYATDVNNSLTIIDGHTHAAGSGVQITPAAININTDLSINNKSLTNIAALTLTPQSITPVNNSTYISGVDLYFVDGNGNNVRMTSGGTVNATSSGISSGTASASFVGGSLVVNSAALTPADIQVASVLMGNHTASSNYLTLQPPNAMAVSYSLTLPSLPAQTNVMTLDTAGNISSVTWNTVANSRTRTVASTTGVGGVAVSPSCGSFFTSSTSPTNITNLSVTIDSSGNPMTIQVQASPGTVSRLVLNSSATNGTGSFELRKNGSIFATYPITFVKTGGAVVAYPSSILTFLDSTPVVGTNLYTLLVYGNDAVNVSIGVENAVLVAYEL